MIEYTYLQKDPSMYLATLFIEAGIVGIFTIVFLILFIVAGIRQKLKDSGDE